MKKLSISLLAAGILTSLISSCGAPRNLPVSSFNAPNTQFQARSAVAPRLGAFSTSQAGKLRIATYNVRNMFDGIKDNPNNPDERAKPDKEYQALSESLHKINADVIGFQEVESKGVLTAFRDKYLQDMGYTEVVLIEGNDSRGIDVALFSRFPISNVTSHKEARFNVPGQGVAGFSRDLLQVQIHPSANYQFTMFVGHLKSQHGGAEADARRLAEATKAQEIINTFQQANPRENVVVVGDFNDTVETQEIAPLVRGTNTVDIIGQDLGSGSNVYTYHPQQYRSRIDYILLNKNMVNEYIPKSVDIHKPYKTEKGWQDLNFYDASDHIPTTIDLDISQDR
jgi:endonuclease/exonuclease/phosphatase family metal-dependent hydrolase